MKKMVFRSDNIFMPPWISTAEFEHISDQENPHLTPKKRVDNWIQNLREFNFKV